LTPAAEQFLDDTRAISILAELIDRPADEREDALRAACGDGALADRVRAMLAADQSEGRFLDEPPILRTPGLDPSRGHGLPPGTRVAGYRIGTMRGSGSMGDVYEAEAPGGGRVALKLLRPGVATRELRRRFEFEIVALSRLHHPNIAGLIASEEFESQEGPRPYLVMELVDGSTITEHVRARNLGGPDLLTLFARVCDAVEHAHRCGVIHRDLKPANILVEAATGEPKIVDFGVAREIDPGATLATLPRTHLIGSAPYMSPEQAAGQAADTRSDVYALGAILYELVAGRPAFSHEGVALPELIRRVREQGPPTLRSSARFGSRARDVALVVSHAMAKRPEDRYSSVGQLAADLRAIAEGRPVAIRPPGLWSVARASARRHKGRVVMASAAAFCVMASAVVAVVHVMDAHDAERHSDQLIEEIVRGTDVFVVALNQRMHAERQPLEARRAVLEAAREYLRRVETRAGDDPRVLESLARVYLELGRVVGGTSTGSLGQTDEAAELFGASARMYESLVASGDTDERRLGLASALSESSIMAGRPVAPEVAKRAAAHMEMVASRVDAAQAAELRARALGLLAAAAAHAGDVTSLRVLEVQLAELCAAEPSNADRWTSLGQAQRFLAEMLAITDRKAAKAVSRACRETTLHAISLGGPERDASTRNFAMNEVVFALLSAGEMPAEDLIPSAEQAVDATCRLMTSDLHDNYARSEHVHVLLTFATAGERIAVADPPAGQHLSRAEIAARVAGKVRGELAFADSNRPPSLAPYPIEADLRRAIQVALARLDAIAAAKAPG
jgi:serine/threonine protein kinase